MSEVILTKQTDLINIIIRYGYKKNLPYSVPLRNRLYIKSRIWEDTITPGSLVITTYHKDNNLRLKVISLDGVKDVVLVLPENYQLDKELGSKIYKAFIKPKLQTSTRFIVDIEDYISLINKDDIKNTVDVAPKYKEEETEVETPVYQFEKVNPERIDVETKEI